MNSWVIIRECTCGVALIAFLYGSEEVAVNYIRQECAIDHCDYGPVDYAMMPLPPIGWEWRSGIPMRELFPEIDWK